MLPRLFSADTVPSAADSELKKAYWFGVQRDSSGAWTWIDGTTWRYANWDTEHGEPDSSGEYIQMYGSLSPSEEIYGTTGKWGDVPENGNSGILTTESYGFICEWEDDTRLEFAVVSTIPEEYINDEFIRRLAVLTLAKYTFSQTRILTPHSLQNLRRK